MNCKPNDLAVVVRSGVGNEGKIVTCIRLLGREERPAGINFMLSQFPIWVTDTPANALVMSGEIRQVMVMTDAALRPIRDEPGEDEMLRIAGYPAGVKETV